MAASLLVPGDSEAEKAVYRRQFLGFRVPMTASRALLSNRSSSWYGAFPLFVVFFCRLSKFTSSRRAADSLLPVGKLVHL